MIRARDRKGRFLWQWHSKHVKAGENGRQWGWVILGNQIRPCSAHKYTWISAMRHCATSGSQRC